MVGTSATNDTIHENACCVCCGRPATSMTREVREKPRWSWDKVPEWREFEVVAAFFWCDEHVPRTSKREKCHAGAV